MLQMLDVFRGIGPRGAQMAAAAKVNSADFFNGQWLYVSRVAFHDPPEAVSYPNHRLTAHDTLNRGGSNHAINTRRRPPTDEDTEKPGLALCGHGSAVPCALGVSEFCNHSV